MKDDLVNIERHVIDAFTHYGIEDLPTLKMVLYDKTKSLHIISADAIRNLVKRYERAEFTVLCTINELEEEQIRRGNYSVKISSTALAPLLPPVEVDTEKRFFTSENHLLFPENLEPFLQYLGKKGLLLIFPNKEGLLFRSKTAEIIRLLLKLPVRRWDSGKKQYWFDSSVATIKYHRQVKKVPSWNQSVSDVITEICEEARTHFIKTGRKFVYEKLRKDHGYPIFERCTKTVLEGFQDFIASKYNVKKEYVKLSEFQVRCIKETLRTKFVFSPIFPRDLVMTAGVASGKTFGFLLGTLIYVLYEKYRFERLKDYSPVVRCLIIYPRVALSKDQYDVILNLLDSINSKSHSVYNLKLTLKVTPDFAGEVSKGSTVYDGLKEEDKDKPDIWISNTETLRRRIKNPVARALFEGFLEFVILDEIHLYEGIEGIHVSKLIQRMLGRYRQNSRRKWNRPMFIGSSATIAQPIEHCSKLFPEAEYGKIQHISATESPTLAHYGIFHHILVKAREGRSLIGTVTDLTSCTLHNIFEDMAKINQQKILSSRSEEITRNLRKIVGFSDSLRVVSRWRDLVRDQEKSFWKGFWEERKAPKVEYTVNFPFYGMFHKPFLWRLRFLKQRAKKWSIEFPDEDSEKLMQRFAIFCEKCRNGERDSINLADCLQAKGLKFVTENIVIPYPSGFRIDNKVENLDRCPFFERGICWWFSRDSAKQYEKYPTKGGSSVECYKDNIRTRISTSRVRETIKNPNEEFTANFYNAFGSAYACGREIEYEGKILLPFLISSPVLEVGVDINNVGGTILHKAIRNLSSYKQKIGRTGREIFSQSHAITLISFDPRERYYYRNSYMLADPTILDPIPLKRTNVDVEKSHALETCFDFFASLGWDIYNIPSNRRDFDKTRKSFDERIRTVMHSDYLRIEKGELKDRTLLNYIIHTNHTTEETALDALKIFRKYISLLATNEVSQFMDKKEDSLASLLVSIIERKSLPSPSKIEVDISKLIYLRDLIQDTRKTIRSLEDKTIEDELLQILEEMEVPG